MVASAYAMHRHLRPSDINPSIYLRDFVRGDIVFGLLCASFVFYVASIIFQLECILTLNQHLVHLAKWDFLPYHSVAMYSFYYSLKTFKTIRQGFGSVPVIFSIYISSVL